MDSSARAARVCRPRGQEDQVRPGGWPGTAPALGAVSASVPVGGPGTHVCAASPRVELEEESLLFFLHFLFFTALLTHNRQLVAQKQGPFHRPRATPAGQAGALPAPRACLPGARCRSHVRSPLSPWPSRPLLSVISALTAPSPHLAAQVLVRDVQQG